jgi:hypothetical protein
LLCETMYRYEGVCIIICLSTHGIILFFHHSALRPIVPLARGGKNIFVSVNPVL